MGPRFASYRRIVQGAVVLLFPVAALEARAQTACPAPPPAPRTWQPPLDRRISIAAHEVTLREALDTIAAAARIRLSYSAELLPLDDAVCLVGQGVRTGDALLALARGAAALVEPVAAGEDLVVLAPVPASRTASRPAPAAAPRPTAVAVERLEPILVTESASDLARRSTPAAIDVIEGAAGARRDARSIAHLLHGAAPGLWLWEPSPASLLAGWGSLRGASSFGASAPKIYIDGVEVANPLVVAHLAPESVERIEIIRGPQGAALHGSDALGGVIEIATRHEGSTGDGARVRLHGTTGMAESDFATGPTLAQEHRLALRAGSAARSAGIDLAAGSVGAFIPGASLRTLDASIRARAIGGSSTLTLTSRLSARDVEVPASPLLPITGASAQSMRHYNVGLAATRIGGERWMQSAVIGIDGYRLGGVPDASWPMISSGDEALLAARGGADRGTVRLRGATRMASELLAATLTLGVEHSVLRQAAEGAPAPTAGLAGAERPPLATEWATSSVVEWAHTSGVLALAEVLVADAFLFRGGMRVERTGALAPDPVVAMLPMLGAAWTREHGALAMRLRAAYGRGIRSPVSLPREDAWALLARHRAGTTLAPESQAGVEAGFDLAFGRALSVQVTRFDQRASGLVQRVTAVEERSGQRSFRRPEPRWTLQNVGEIANRGWEVQGTAGHGPFALAGALALVDSRVERIAPAYAGDLRVGDRMLEVPSRTMSVTASWTNASWFASIAGSRASDWVNYDRLRLTQGFAAGDLPAPEDLGDWLRSHWMTYGGVTRLHASVSRRLPRGLTVTLTGDNLLDVQRGEPDNLTVLPGRTIGLGIGVQF